jgi:S1-C subfamily serine protease
MDEDHDLALLRIARQGPGVVPLASEAEIALGDNLYTLGFPVPNLQGFNPKLTHGIVSARTGLMDEPGFLQISAPIQPGNSGGAIVSTRGCLIGIASSTIGTRLFLQASGNLPQNVNYAIGLRPIHEFLQRAKVELATAGFEDKNMAIENLSKATVLILTYKL